MVDPTSARKLAHVDVCLERSVTYRTRTTGFEAIDLPYRALPETDLNEVSTRTTFLGGEMAAPILIGAMTGGSRLGATVNRNLAIAAQRTGVGMMLGSQRVMLERPDAVADFAVRRYAPDVPIVGNLGVAQLNLGYGPVEIVRAIDAVDADGLALHANPLQEAMQEEGDGDFRGLIGALRTLPERVGRPLLLKEVGHGLDADTVAALAEAGFAAFDVAGAGGTSWARVEALVRGDDRADEALLELGIPTAEALRAARAVAGATPLIASGGVRGGSDVAKAIASGASWCAAALPLLRPATESPDAVEAVLRRWIRDLRIAMHACGATDLNALGSVRLVQRSSDRRSRPADRP